MGLVAETKVGLEAVAAHSMVVIPTDVQEECADQRQGEEMCTREDAAAAGVAVCQSKCCTPIDCLPWNLAGRSTCCCRSAASTAGSSAGLSGGPRRVEGTLTMAIGDAGVISLGWAGNGDRSWAQDYTGSAQTGIDSASAGGGVDAGAAGTGLAPGQRDGDRHRSLCRCHRRQPIVDSRPSPGARPAQDRNRMMLVLSLLKVMWTMMGAI